MLMLSLAAPRLGAMPTDSELRKRIGGRLLIERIQVKNWNELKAANEAGLTPGTIRRIERGENYEVESLEKYAMALGRDLSAWLVEILLEGKKEPGAPGAPPPRTPKERTRVK